MALPVWGRSEDVGRIASFLTCGLAGVVKYLRGSIGFLASEW